MDEFTNVRPLPPPLPPPIKPERMMNRAPWFVGVRDQHERMLLAVNKNFCWLCGERTGQFIAFVVGPLSAVTHQATEPPMHKDCALYAARMGMPINEAQWTPTVEPVHRVRLVWIAQEYKLIMRPGNSPLCLTFDMGHPSELHWFKDGQRATLVEVEAEINAGLLDLQTKASETSPMEMAKLGSAIDQMRLLLRTV